VLLTQDYTGCVFVDDELGAIDGALSLSDIAYVGSAILPRPAIVVGFRSFSTSADEPLRHAAVVSDSDFQHGQGCHGGFSRAETMNFMAAVGPAFRRRYRDALPASTADIARTIAHILQLKPADKGRLRGRILTEALPGGRIPKSSTHIRRAKADANGLATTMTYQRVGRVRYIDAAGIPGRVVGLDETIVEHARPAA
jgi:hypothetical protein